MTKKAKKKAGAKRRATKHIRRRQDRAKKAKGLLKRGVTIKLPWDGDEDALAASLQYSEWDVLKPRLEHILDAAESGTIPDLPAAEALWEALIAHLREVCELDEDQVHACVNRFLARTRAAEAIEEEDYGEGWDEGNQQDSKVG